MKVAVVQHLAGGRVDQRVLGRRVQLHPQHPLDVTERIGRRAVYLRQRPQPVRVLDPRGGAGGVRAEQLTQPPRGGPLARVRPGRLPPAPRTAARSRTGPGG